jgi:hypothetical protein
MSRALLLAALLLGGCVIWDADDSVVAVSPPPSDTADGSTVRETWRSLLILNNGSDAVICEVRAQTAADLEPSPSDPVVRRLVVPAQTTLSGGDLCVFCEGIEGACEPVALYTCRAEGWPDIEREWMWWVRCA